MAGQSKTSRLVNYATSTQEQYAQALNRYAPLGDKIDGRLYDIVYSFYQSALHGKQPFGIIGLLDMLDEKRFWTHWRHNNPQKQLIESKCKNLLVILDTPAFRQELDQLPQLQQIQTCYRLIANLDQCEPGINYLTVKCAEWVFLPELLRTPKIIPDSTHSLTDYLVAIIGLAAIVSPYLDSKQTRDAFRTLHRNVLKVLSAPINDISQDEDEDLINLSAKIKGSADKYGTWADSVLALLSLFETIDSLQQAKDDPTLDKIANAIKASYDSVDSTISICKKFGLIRGGNQPPWLDLLGRTVQYLVKTIVIGLEAIDAFNKDNSDKAWKVYFDLFALILLPVASEGAAPIVAALLIVWSLIAPGGASDRFKTWLTYCHFGKKHGEFKKDKELALEWESVYFRWDRPESIARQISEFYSLDTKRLGLKIDRRGGMPPIFVCSITPPRAYQGAIVNLWTYKKDGKRTGHLFRVGEMPLVPDGEVESFVTDPAKPADGVLVKSITLYLKFESTLLPDFVELEFLPNGYPGDLYSLPPETIEMLPDVIRGRQKLPS